MSLKEMTVVVTSDGKQFTDRAEALAHQSKLDNAEVIAKVANSYANVTSAPGAKEVGLVGRTRVFQVNAAEAVVSFLIAQGLIDVSLLQAFDGIEQSEELKARIAVDAAEAEAKAKAKAEAKGAEPKKEDKPVVDGDADVDADLFGSEQSA